MNERAALTVRLGRSELEVTRVGFGYGPLGNVTGSENSADWARAVLEAAWDHGLRYFDTAPLYGCGFAERCLGDALRERPRDQFVLSTKVGRLVKTIGDRAASAEFDFSREGV